MNSKSTLKRLRLPIYPWLLGVFPVLHLYSVNFGAVIDREVPVCLLWLMAGTSFAYIAINLILRNRHETALVVSFVILGFSLGGHIHALIFEGELLLIWTAAVLLLIAAASAELHKIRASFDFERAAIPMNVVSIALVLLQLATLAARYAETYGDLSAGSFGGGPGAARQSSAKIHDSDQMPDVYYIIPDGYPSNGWLQRTVDFDNAAFTEALKDRGFEVTLHAQSNCGITLPSLASTLNMRYFDANPTDLHDVDYLRMSVANSDVAKFFQQLGYSYIQFLSGYLIPSTIADINRDFTPSGTVDVLTDDNLTAILQDNVRNTQTVIDSRRLYQQSFVAMYIETTLLKVVSDELQRLLEGHFTGRYEIYSPRRFLDTVEGVAAVATMPEATFTIIHLTKPHRPLYFDENGIIDKISNPSDEEFIAGLNFVNDRFLDMFDTILAGSQHEPVIIFQADHGTTKGEVRRAGWRPIHFDVFSAYYVPERYKIEIPQPHTNVNTFPLILNAVFGANFAHQENRLFELLKSNSRPFVQADVTEMFAHG